MKGFYHIIIGFFCFYSIYSQTNTDKFVQAMQQGNAQSALEHFNSINNKEVLKSEIHYLASLAYTKNNQLEDALEQLDIASIKGLANIESQNDASLDTLKTLKGFDKIHKKIMKNEVIASKELDRLREEFAFKFKKDIQSRKIALNMTPVKHQGQRNTCSVFAATSIAEYLLNQESETEIDLSESYNYYIAKKKALSNSFLKKTYEPVDGLAGYLALDGYNYGASKEEEWPYEIQNWIQTNNEKCKRPNGIADVECYTGLPKANIKLLDKAFKTIFIPFEKIGDYILSEKKPVLVNIWLYQNGINMQTGQLNSPPEGKEILMGGHVVVLTGYDAEKEEYLYKNSWGNTWGNKGYGTMPKAYLEKHFEASGFIPFNLDATDDEKHFLAKVSLGASLILE